MPTRPVLGRVLASIATIGYGGALGLEGPSIYAGLRYRVGHPAPVRPVLLPRGRQAAAGGRGGRGRVRHLQGAGHRCAVRHRGALPGRPRPPQRAARHGGVGGRLRHVRRVRRHRPDPAGGGDGLTVRLAGPRRRRSPWACCAGSAPGCSAPALRCAPGAAAASRCPDRPAARSRAGVALAGLAYAGRAAADAPLTLGPGYDVIRWATDPSLAQWLVLRSCVLRVGAVLATLRRRRRGRLVRPAGGAGRADRAPRGRRVRHGRHRPVAGRGHGGVPRRRVPHAAGGRDVRGRDDGPARLRGAGAGGDGGVAAAWSATRRCPTSSGRGASATSSGASSCRSAPCSRPTCARCRPTPPSRSS